MIISRCTFQTTLKPLFQSDRERKVHILSDLVKESTFSVPETYIPDMQNVRSPHGKHTFQIR